MRIVKLFLPGRFEDAYLYMGRLLVLTEERTLREYNLDRITDFIDTGEQGYGYGYAPIATTMFARNDWLASSQFKLLMQNNLLLQAFLAALDRFPQPFLDLANAAPAIIDVELRIPGHLLLDMTIYNKRLYVGADTGLYHVDLDWNTNVPMTIHTPQRRMDARCISTSANYGAVTASCGNDGLFTILDDFGWSKRDTTPTPTETAKTSIRAGWMTYDLINYATPTQPLVFRTRHEPARDDDRRAERDRTVLTNIGTERISLSFLFDRIQQDYGIDRDAVQYTYNSNNMVFIHTWRGDFYFLGLKDIWGEEPSVRFTRTYKGEGTRILSAHWSKPGLVIETDERVLLFAHGEWHAIIESAVLSVRTFPKSRRFQNLVAVTTEDGVLLAGMFDEEPTRNRAEPRRR